ncbi:hypothetical protein [Maribacter sp. 2210JD10-5]|uniref:hypothetical protein n=1 Tax=Maribacter sp. 2210JD10-5 TaxID=3386272 RepID=UPI0039BC68B1
MRSFLGKIRLSHIEGDGSLPMSWDQQGNAQNYRKSIPPESLQLSDKVAMMDQGIWLLNNQLKRYSLAI